ncbi:PLC-like phosphodiesterase [Xylariaceae sp. FL1651]|nr:PLC-like phosphodiesterase [Xylariaceae sp. FL1651]
MSVLKDSSNAAVSEQSPLLGSENELTMGNFPVLENTTLGSQVTQVRKPLPQTIGHRGFKAAAPENTMMAFKAAVDAGVEAVETDLHLTRDGVIVLCHDETLERCYGDKAKVRDLDWDEISKFRTLREPHQPMPRLVDLLEYLDKPGLEDIWLMLDIKTHDDAEEMMQRIAEALASVPSKRPWAERVTPCCWNVTYIKLSMKYLPDYHITHLGFSTTYARCLTDIPNISFSMLHYTLASPLGGLFLRDMKRLGIPVHVWTLNEESWMEWAIRKELSGVITDEVVLFHEVCDRMGDGQGEHATTSKKRKRTGLKSWFLYRTVRFWGEMVLFHFLLAVFMGKDWLKHGSPRSHIRKTLKV